MKIRPLFALLLFPSVPLSTPVYAGQPAEFRTEIVSPGSVSIGSAHTTWWRGRMIVGGFVEKKFGYSGGWANSHLDVIVLNKDGRLLSTTPTNYFPRPIPANYRGRIGRATYAQSLPSIPSAGSTIRVFHHQTPIKECREASLPTRSAVK